jgi:clan AA aspartic protease (TIGR02281 family)
MLLLSNVAHAADVYYSETCGSSVLLVGTYSRDRDVSVHAVYDHGYWRVQHTLSNGHVYDRGVQYAINDTTTLGADGIYTSWTGQLNRNPAISMTGHLYMNGAEPHYREVMTKNGQTIMVSDAACTFDSPPTGGARPPVVATNAAPAPTYTSPASMRLPITFGHSGAYVAVSIGTTAATMLVDTGATGMTISESIADQLIASGQATSAPSETVTLAGGVKQEFRQVNISSVTVGGHVVNNVHAGVTPDGSDMLLGLSVLAQVAPKFAINVANSTLDFD